MNPFAIGHLLLAIVTIAISVPLIQRKVKMNRWYGVRIPAAFKSEEAWFDINRYGGRLLLFWGIAIAAMAIVGAFLEMHDWIAYNRAALGVILGGLGIVLAMIYRYARRRKRA